MDINNIHGTKGASVIDGTSRGITYGYIRVSTAIQHDERQRMAMKDFGIASECLFTDKSSGI